MKNYWHVFSLMILVGCLPANRVYEEHKELSSKLEWKKSDGREFTVPVDDHSIPYNLIITFRYAQGYPFKTALVKLTEKTPSGKVTTTEHELNIRDANGGYLGDPGLDIWDSEHTIEPGKTFDETGEHTYTIVHVMPMDTLPLVMEIGMALDKVVVEKK